MTRRSQSGAFSAIVALFLILLVAPFAFAQAPEEPITTITSTQTIYRVVTETRTGTPPASETTFTSASSYSSSSYGTSVPYSSANATSSTGTAPQPEFTGAAFRMDTANGVAIAVAGVMLGFAVL